MAEDQLKNIRPLSVHLLYEISMLSYALKRLRKIVNIPKKKRNDDEKRHLNIYLENFLLHARILNDFFSNERKKDDIIADDFINSQSNPVFQNIADDMVERINKQLAHLSEKRIKNRNINYLECLSIGEILVSNIKYFNNHVDHGELMPNFCEICNSRISDIEEVISQTMDQNEAYAENTTRPNEGYAENTTRPNEAYAENTTRPEALFSEYRPHIK